MILTKPSGTRLKPSASSLKTPSPTPTGARPITRGELDQAITDQSEAIRLNPKLAFAYTERGAAYAAKREFERAITDYTESIRIDPTYSHAYNNRGAAYENMGDFKRAIADYDAAFAINPQDTWTEAARTRVR